MTNAAPIAPPHSLRVLGIISLVVAPLATAWSIAAAVITIGHIDTFAGEAHLAPDKYNLWVIIMGAVNTGLGLLLLLAGLGLTLRARWGRTLGLLYALLAIPLSIATWTGPFVLVGILQGAANESAANDFGGPRVIATTLFSGTTCFTPVLGIVFLSLFFSNSMRRWAKTRPGDAAAATSTAISSEPITTPATVSSGMALPTTHPTEHPLAFGPSPAPQFPASPTIMLTQQPLSVMPASGYQPTGTPVTFANLPAAISSVPSTPPSASRLSMLALFGFLLALCPILPFLGQITALILASMGLRRVARSDGALHGRGLAIAGIIIAGTWLLLLTVLVVIVIIVTQTNK